MGLKKCKVCDGSGSNIERDGICKACDGTGRVSSGKKPGGWLMVILFLLLWTGSVEAYDQWTVDNVYKAIATESIGEGREGMEYVASCFWNRIHGGLQLGSSGLHRHNLDQWLSEQPDDLLAYAYDLSNRVLFGVDNFDLVHGATHFESTDFPTPRWAKDHSHIQCFAFKKHIFYKERIREAPNAFTGERR